MGFQLPRIILGITLFSTYPAEAITPISPPVGEVVQFGICEYRDPKLYVLPQSTTGSGVTATLWLTEKTVNIPLKKGAGFGFVWKADNLPERAEITYSYKHPPITRPDGVTLTGYEESLVKKTRGGSIKSIDCYVLREDHELVAGQWILSVLYRGSLLAEKSFYVYEASNP